MLERVLIEVRGVVQGVGFRPFVHSLATSLDLRGYVQNRGAHVYIDVEGDRDALAAFQARLPSAAPPRASVEHVNVQHASVAHHRRFAIAASDAAAADDIRVAADIATCDACLAELFDGSNRRFRYPFINCTSCGPRFTIVTGVPYDRTRTTMARFAMCEECRREYEDPGNRRFHAEPIACERCGPSLSLAAEAGTPLAGERALAAAVVALRSGRIVAIKGLGGYHLACDATDEAAVAALRRRKGREAKPLAIMAREADVRGLLEPAAFHEARLRALRDALASPARPIVLIARAAWAAARAPALAPNVAPGCPALGLMLPYTPLHHLLLHDCGRPLVMTSGNRTDDPIAFRDDEALATLGPIADLMLAHDRPIHVRCDDSIVSVAAGAARLVRRARGYAPDALRLAEAAPAPILAVGGHQKSAFCIADGQRAFLSPHVGDLEHLSAYQALGEGVAHYAHLLGVAPRVIAHDLHPDYLSTRLALELPADWRLAVQHHHAHVLSCAAENGVTAPLIGVAFDGAGFGTDGAVWGGEFLIVERTAFRRAAHLAYVPQPGGDRAARDSWRMALAHAMAAGGAECEQAIGALAAHTPPASLAAVRQIVAKRLAVDTSSVGRLFDAAAALIGVRQQCAFEGQAAMELEALAAGVGAPGYAFELSTAAEPWIVEPAPVIRALARDSRAGRPAAEIAAMFHGALAEAIAAVAGRLSRRSGIRRVALTGGVFQNALLTRLAAQALSKAGLEVLLHRRVPCNDGGLALGQAVAAARLMRGRVEEGSHACA